MGICTDRSVNYLKSLNLNTIRHPEENIAPLDLIGEYKGARAIIGSLDQLVDGAAEPLPAIGSGAAADVSGQRTSRLPLSVGLDILGNIITPLGGNLAVKAAYENCRRIEFTFLNVERHRANVIGIGDFVQSGDVRWNHIILDKYLFGSGNLYVITDVVKSDMIGVSAFKSDNSRLDVEIPKIEELVGAEVSVAVESQATNTVSYRGKKQLAFGFSAIELSAGEQDGSDDLRLVYRPVEAGSVPMAARDDGAAAVKMEVEGSIRELGRADPQTLGE